MIKRNFSKFKDVKMFDVERMEIKIISIQEQILRNLITCKTFVNKFQKIKDLNWIALTKN